MSTQRNAIKKMQEEAHLQLLKTKALLLEVQVRIIKMKASAMKARIQTLKNLALIGHVEI